MGYCHVPSSEVLPHSGGVPSPACALVVCCLYGSYMTCVLALVVSLSDQGEDGRQSTRHFRVRPLHISNKFLRCRG